MLAHTLHVMAIKRSELLLERLFFYVIRRNSLGAVRERLRSCANMIRRNLNLPPRSPVVRVAGLTLAAATANATDLHSNPRWVLIPLFAIFIFNGAIKKRSGEAYKPSLGSRELT
jgi:hypothetical protein